MQQDFHYPGELPVAPASSVDENNYHHRYWRSGYATTDMSILHTAQACSAQESANSEIHLNDPSHGPFFDQSAPYQSMSPYDDFRKPDVTSKRKKWVVVAILIVAAIIGVAVGVPLSKKKNSKNYNVNAGNSGTTGSSDNNGSNHPPSGPSGPDPSVFPKDPNLHQSFYGMAYTPVGSQLPNCGNTLAGVIQDIQIMSQLTKRIRLYGADCNQSALVLEAIRQTKVDMQVYLGNYNVPNDNDAAYNRQKGQIKEVITNYGTGSVAGVTVGNEFMLNYILGNGGGDVNSPVGDQGAALLIPNIEDTRTMLQSMNLNIPVGNSDAGAYFNNKVLAAIDYGMANVHPWFGNVAIDDAAQWTMTFFQTQDVDVANKVPNKPKMSIAETGWPTKSSDPATATNGPSAASVENLQKFLDTFICQANQAGVEYFYFELFDEVWKDQQFGGVEGWWGLFNADRTLKAITIPNCPAP
ncbi:hypothetical protein AX15_001971 [Amanita polypyramis BW_CC]|nr:hypothetical protein AX15_001971 [Amanita polypyramis BW_CC]